MKKLLSLLGFAVIAFGVSVVFATPSHAGLLDLLPGGGGGGGEAPEIDPSAIGSAIALVMGSAAMLKDRFGR